MSLVPVSRERHGSKKLTALTSYAFAARSPLVQIVAAELPQITACYPILFVDIAGHKVPHALLGLAKDQNCFVSAEGAWTGYYIPATFRRYPFQFSRSADGNTVTVLVDEASGLLSDTEGEPLFGTEEGDPNGPLARAIQFLTEIDIDISKTGSLAEILARHDLFEPFTLQVGEGVSMEGLYTVSEAKLNALPDEAFLELRRSGALVLAHAQLLSLAQFGRLQGASVDSSQK